MTVWVCVLLASIDRIEEVGMGIGIIIVVPFMTMGSVLFAPAVVSAYRGMIVEVPLHLGAMRQDPHADRLRNALAEFYADCPMVRVHQGDAPSELVLEKDVAPTDGLELFVFGNEGGWNARLVARLDNLGKGASGAAVQNLNLLCGLPETAGLTLPTA